MSVTFTIKINGIRTATVGDKTDVVKQVDWIMSGTEESQTFELPQTTTLPDPDGQPFVPLNQLTEAEVIAWVEAHAENIPAIKAHIEYVLNREVAKAALATASMPWAPVEQTPVEPAPGA